MNHPYLFPTYMRHALGTVPALAYARIGQDAAPRPVGAVIPAPNPADDMPGDPRVNPTALTDNTSGFLRTIPTLLALGIVTGAAIAIGNSLAAKYILREKR